MLLPLAHLVSRYGVKVTSILHCGAYLGEEAHAYSFLNPRRVVWLEADPHTCARLRKRMKRFPNNEVIQAVLSDTDGELVKFNVANNGQSSSLLELGTHATEHPRIVFVDSFMAETIKLDTLMQWHMLEDCDFLYMDLQGAEALALRGGADYLRHVKYVYTEVNKVPVYVRGALVGDIDHLLSTYGLVRVETQWTRHGWGDAFYVKLP